MMQSKNSRGFTLIELMVTLAVAIIILAVAVPSFRSTTHSTRMTAQVNAFASFLMLARAEAVKRQRNITVASVAGAGSNEWGGGAQMRDASDVIATLDAFNGNITMDSDAGVTAITFIPRGYANPAVAGNFNVCETSSNEDGRQFMITATGKVILITRSFPCS